MTWEAAPFSLPAVRLWAVSSSGDPGGCGITARLFRGGDAIDVWADGEPSDMDNVIGSTTSTFTIQIKHICSISSHNVWLSPQFQDYAMIIRGSSGILPHNFSHLTLICNYMQCMLRTSYPLKLQTIKWILLDPLPQEMGFHRQRTMWLWINPDNVTHRQLLSIDQIWRRSTALTWSRWGCHRLADNISNLSTR